MKHRNILVAIGAAILVASALSMGPAQGAAGTSCTFEYDAVISPGLSSSPSSGTITSDGETGTITCNGPVNGKQPTGPGTFGVEARYGTKGGDTCQSGGEGDGVLAFTIPTSSGAEHVTSNFTYTFGGLQNGVLFAQYDGDRMSGTTEVTPQEGDCASRPVTKAHTKGKGTLS